MAALGSDFIRARHEWLYDVSTKPRLLPALAGLVGLFVLISISQGLFGYLIFMLQHGPESDASLPLTEIQNNFAKATIVGMLPAGLVSALAAWWLARLSFGPRNNGMPLHAPRLGPAGWVVVIGSFIIGVYAVFFIVFSLLGVDPQDYMPKPGGLGEDTSSAGLVERIVADLADEPLLFAMALPGITIAMPIAEELVFRGPVFAALAASPAGRWGAVMLTSAIWAVIHITAPWIIVAIIFMMGVILGLLLLRFGSLWVTIVCHCIWNAMSSSVIFGSQQVPGAQ